MQISKMVVFYIVEKKTNKIYDIKNTDVLQNILVFYSNQD